MKSRIKVSILPNQFLKENGTFNKETAIQLAGQIAGVCYDEEGFEHIKTEANEITMRRVDRTLNNGHHSVYDHIWISFNIENIPKILAMVLNNEHQYTTSEKSARYTPIVRDADEIITETEARLYDKWLDIFKMKIKAQYGDVYTNTKIRRLAQENARYLVTAFMPTKMIYSTSLRQINYLASWMQEYIRNIDTNNLFERNLAVSMQDLLNQLQEINVLEEGLMRNEKSRKLSLFSQELDQKEEHFGAGYLTIYKASLAELAQAQRHRTLDYQMELLEEKEYFIPPIITDDQMLVDEWLEDMLRVKGTTPQGELVRISEEGKYADFILKCKERLCSEAQIEIMQQTRQTLLKYQEALQQTDSYLARDIEQYTHGARCTFPDFKCSKDCKFKEGKTLRRKI